MPSATLRPPPAAALRRRRGGRGRDPWRRSGDPPGHQLRQPRGVVARRPADVRRAAHPRRQLVELPAAQARRLARVPRQQRGDLLLPDRRRRRRPTTPPKASGCIAPTPATAGSTTTSTVGDGDVYLIPRGYHGPCVAAPGYTMYYLNVLAGPGGERSMAFCDDPTHHWVRAVVGRDGDRSALSDDRRRRRRVARIPTDPRLGVPCPDQPSSIESPPPPSRGASARRPGGGCSCRSTGCWPRRAQLGITAMEQGALGWLPTDPDRAARQARRVRHAAARRLRAARAARPRPARGDDGDRRATSPPTWRRPAASYFVTAVVGSLDDWFRPEMTDASWSGAVRQPRPRRGDLPRPRADPGRAPARRHADRDRPTSSTASSTQSSVRFCFDTGHLTIGGADVVRRRPRAASTGSASSTSRTSTATSPPASAAGELDLMAATQAGPVPVDRRRHRARSPRSSRRSSRAATTAGT